MIKNLIDNNIGNAFAASMLNVLKNEKNQKLFKKAEAACNCKKDCDCNKESCKCKKSGCNISCLSCGKEKTVEASSKIIEELLSVSAVFDHYGLEKQSTSILNIANKYLRKLSSVDLNDLKMKNLNEDLPLEKDLHDEIDELEKDPEYTQWAKNPDFFSDIKRKDELAKIPDRFFEKEFKHDEMDPDLEKYLLESELDIDVFNADDEDVEVTTLQSPRTYDEPPNTERSDASFLNSLEEEFAADPISEDDYIEEEFETRDTIPPSTLRSAAQKNEILLRKSLMKVEKYFSKLAEENNEEKDLDEDFEDEE